MTSVRRALALVAIGLAALLPTAARAQGDTTTYRDAAHGFSVSFPSDWRQVSFKDGPEFHALADGGKGPEDCNLNVTTVSGPAYLDRITREQMLANLRTAMKDASLVEWRRQTLDRRWGLYYIVSGTTPRQGLKQTTLGFQVVGCVKEDARLLYDARCIESILGSTAHQA